MFIKYSVTGKSICRPEVRKWFLSGRREEVWLSACARLDSGCSARLLDQGVGYTKMFTLVIPSYAYDLCTLLYVCSALIKMVKRFNLAHYKHIHEISTFLEHCHHHSLSFLLRQLQFDSSFSSFPNPNCHELFWLLALRYVLQLSLMWSNLIFMSIAFLLMQIFPSISLTNWILSY